MKHLIALLLMTTAVSAQVTAPVTLPLNNDKKEVIGTATSAGDGRIYLRDLKGELFATIVTDPTTKKQTFYDPSGNVISKIPGLNQ